MTLHVRTVEVADDRPLLDILDREGTGDRFAMVRAGEGLVGWGSAARIEVGTGPDRFDRAGAAVADLLGSSDVEDAVRRSGTGPVAFGSFAFAPDDDRSVLVVPRVVVGREGDVTWRTTVDPRDGAPAPSAPQGSHQDGDPDDARPRSAGSTVDEVAWVAAVARAIGEIDAGGLRKVVLARDQLLWARRPFDVDRILAALAARHPSCFVFLVDGFLGASPELLLEVRAGAARSEVLAGTVAREVGAAEDDAAGRALLVSPKDLEEHALAVESVRDVLAAACADLVADATPHLLPLADVQHLATGFRGTLHADVGTLGLLGRLHPTAAVGGTPRDAALDAIARLEGLDRARYAAPVGWVDADGDGTWAVALRCAEIDGTRARLLAGAGVVAGSLPEAELRETHLKLRAMRAALGA